MKLIPFCCLMLVSLAALLFYIKTCHQWNGPTSWRFPVAHLTIEDRKLTSVSKETCSGLSFGDKCIIISAPVIKTYLLVGILSANKNVENRQSVRLTWKQFSGNWRLVFLLGLPNDENVKVENATHGDLILVNETEKYFGESSVLPTKTLSLYWIAQKVKPKWVLKTDDDSFVDIPRLFNVLVALQTPFYGGHIWRKATPVKDPKHRSYVSSKHWNGSFPDYASGAGYIVSGDLMQCFINNIHHTVKMPREDVLSGLLAQHCKIKPTQIKGLLFPSFTNKEPIIKHKIKSQTRMTSIWNKYNITWDKFHSVD